MRSISIVFGLTRKAHHGRLQTLSRGQTARVPWARPEIRRGKGTAADQESRAGEGLRRGAAAGERPEAGVQKGRNVRRRPRRSRTPARFKQSSRPPCHIAYRAPAGPFVLSRTQKIN
jgi:hypothetical protein